LYKFKQIRFVIFQAEEVLEDILSYEASSLASDSIKVVDSALNISSDIQV
jgi:hypothetical protein